MAGGGRCWVSVQERQGKEQNGIFLNPVNAGFASSVRSSIYVDKTELLDFTNHASGTEDKFICVSRPRRFCSACGAIRQI